MSHGITKDTYVNADSKTTKALTYDMLNDIGKSIEDMKKVHVEHLEVCNKRFKGLESRRKKDTVIASGSGVIGGFLAVTSTWIKNLFT